MVVLSHIYTKTGDQGSTSLGDGTKTNKADQRLEAFATVDEANAHIGVVLSFGKLVDQDVQEILNRIQNDLFDVGADLCTPVVKDPKVTPLRVTESQITYLENKIDIFNEPLNPLRSFVLPNGTYVSALLHVARTVVRRAERETWKAIYEYGDGVNILAAQYLNRLSDLLFVLARYENRNSGDSLWVPGKNR